MTGMKSKYVEDTEIIHKEVKYLKEKRQIHREILLSEPLTETPDRVAEAILLFCQVRITDV